MKVLIAVLLIVSLSLMCNGRLIMPGMTHGAKQITLEQAEEISSCGYTLIKTSMKLAEISRHISSDWILLISDLIELFTLIKDSFQLCFADQPYSS